MKLTLAEMAAHFDAEVDAMETWGDSPRDQWRKTTLQSVLDRSEVGPEDVVLELGCGTGLISRHLAPHVSRVVAVDCSPKALERARAEAAGQGNIHWLRGDMRDPPGVPDITTAIFCDSLRYLSPPERKATLRKVWSMLPEDGLLIIGDLIWTIAPEQVEDADALGLEDFAYTLLAEPLGQLLAGLGSGPRLLALHPSRSVVTALKGG